MATLIFHLEDEREIVVPLLETVTLGSSDGNDVLVDDSSISPLHAEIALSATGSFVVRDLDSGSGTFVNGRRVKSCPLCEGDEVRFGQLRGKFLLDEKDRASLVQRVSEERERRKELEQFDTEYAASLSKHQTLLAVIQGLGDEEMNRMGNLDDLQRAVNRAEAGLASVAAKEKAALEALQKHEAEQEELQKAIATLTAERKDLAAKHQQCLAEEKKKQENLTKQGDKKRASLEAELEQLTTKQQAAQLKLDSTKEELTRTEAALNERNATLASHRAAITAAEKQLKEIEQAIAGGRKTQEEAAQAKEQAVQESAQVTSALKELEQQRQKAGEDLEKLIRQHAKQTATFTALETSVKDMTQRQAHGVQALRERERSLRELLKSIEAQRAEQARVQEETRHLEEQRDAIQSGIEALNNHTAELHEYIAGLDAQVHERQDHISDLDHRIHQLESDRDAVQSRVKTLTGIEGELLRAQAELKQARQDHASLMAMVAERDERQRELDATIARIEELTQGRRQAEEDLAAARTALRDFHESATLEQQRMSTQTEALRKEGAAEREKLAGITRQLQETATRHEGLLKLNRELDGVDDQLRKTQAELRSAQHEQSEVKKRIAALEKESDKARANLESLNGQVKSVTTTLEKHRAEEEAINRELDKLEDEQAQEKKRLESLRHQLTEEEKKAASERAALVAEFEKRRKDILIQDDQYHQIVALREEIDALYARIQATGTDPAAAFAAWKEAQKKKEELTGILPKEGGIRVKPQVRTVLVPRAKDI